MFGIFDRIDQKKRQIAKIFKAHSSKAYLIEHQVDLASHNQYF